MSRIGTVAILFALAVPAGATSVPKRARITGIAHYAVQARDVSRARSFYRDFLGLPSVADRFYAINDRQYVELQAEKQPATDRLDHLALETDDATMLLAGLQQRGLAVGAKVEKTPTGDLAFSVADPDGHVLEFVQYLPGGLRARPRERAPVPAVSTAMRHVGILVGSLQSSLAFYRGVLGFSETWRGSRDEKVLNWVNLKLPDSEDYIELMLYKDLPEPTKRGTSHHVCLFVDDIQAARTALEPRAATAGYAQPLEIRTGVNRKRQLNLYDPDGTRTELMEPHTVDGKPTPSSAAAPPRP